MLAWKKSAEETCGLVGVLVEGDGTVGGEWVHFSLGLVLLLFLLSFYLAGHLVLLSACEYQYRGG